MKYKKIKDILKTKNKFIDHKHCLNCGEVIYKDMFCLKCNKELKELKDILH